ncbi:MAG: PilZ domain-containing protein [Methylococcaceae bacterium]
MHINMDRSYRKNLTLHGVIYMGGEERKITVKNLSISGLLAELNSNGQIKDIFKTLLVSTIIDLYLPELRLASEVEVIRVDTQEELILLALEFKHITYNVDNLLCKRKAYRRMMPGPGLILFNGEYHLFNAVNVSVGGLMVRLDKTMSINEGLITKFEFRQLDLVGEVKVIWADFIPEGGMLIGLQYVHMEKIEAKNI